MKIIWLDIGYVNFSPLNAYSYMLDVYSSYFQSPIYALDCLLSKNILRYICKIRVSGIWTYFENGPCTWNNFICLASLIFFLVCLMYLLHVYNISFIRPEMVVGWYHSHPGFGCWLSGVDINTQQSFEALSERAVAVVVDPIQSVKGKVSVL